jgi:hypothetical protein
MAVNTFPPDLCATTGTRFSFSVSYLKVIPDFFLYWLSGTDYSIDAGLKHAADGPIQRFKVVGSQLSHKRFRVNPRIEQDLVRICVADRTDR